MIKGSIVAKRKKFIKEMIPVDTVAGMIEAYKKAYPTCKKDSTARVGAYLLLQNPDILKAIDEGKKELEAKIKKAQDEEIQRMAKEEIMSVLEIRAMLSRIAKGSFKRKKVVAAINTTTGKVFKAEIEEAPTETDMISAADKLLKVSGAYAPEKQIHEAGDSFIDMMKMITSKKRKEDGVSNSSH